MRAIRLAVLLSFVLAGTLLAQSNVAFPPEVYAARRARLVETLGDGVAIVPGRHLIGQLSWGPIKQDPNFWYLTEISGEGLVEVMRRVRPGMTTLEVAGTMEAVWKREGSPRAAFETIVNAGPQMTFFTIANEQYHATNRVIGENDLVFIDYGAAEYDMYTSDLCRTIPASGKFTDEQRKYYDIVEEARVAAVAAIKPDAMLLDAVKAAARVFEQHGLRQYEDVDAMGTDKVWGLFPSPTHYLTRNAGMVRGIRALGHFIGLYIPEKGITIMIEDMVLVTETGNEILSPHAPTDSNAIERLMASAR